MMTESASLLPDRGIVAVEGPDAPDLLNRLFTNGMLGLSVGEARYAALLTPQGKLLADFLAIGAPPVVDAPTILLDCDRSVVADLAKRLSFQKLRAKVTIADRSAAFGVAAAWDTPRPDGWIVARDPRHEALGWRIIGPREDLDARYPDASDRYEQHRIALGIPKGGLDFAYGDTFVHDANLDRLAGVDFKKGCYVGQEVVARVHFRKSARKRVVPIRFEAPPRTGAEVRAGDTVLGLVGSVGHGEGLALLRLDRLADAVATGLPLSAEGKPLSVEVPESLSLPALAAHG